MTRPVFFRKAARLDFNDACAWCERQRVGLGRRFAMAVEHALESISNSPESYQSVYRDVRRAFVRPFPYAVYYRVRSESIHVVAIMHGRRDPTSWESRGDADG